MLKEALQPSMPANGTASMPMLASSGSPNQSNSGLDALHESLPGIKAQPRPKRRKAAAKAIPHSVAEHQHSGISAPELSHSSHSARALKAGATLPASLNGFQKPAQSPFHGPMKPLRPAEKQHVPIAAPNTEHQQLQAEPEQAPDECQAHLESLDCQPEQALQAQASDDADRAEAAGEQVAVDEAICTVAAVEQEAAEEAACTEALSLALTGKAPAPFPVLQPSKALPWSQTTTKAEGSTTVLKCWQFWLTSAGATLCIYVCCAYSSCGMPVQCTCGTVCMQRTGVPPASNAQGPPGC